MEQEIKTDDFYHLETKNINNNIKLNRTQRQLLLAAAAVSSGSGLAVELLLGTLASYLVGNQALAYGIAVGGFLAAMGIGSYLSRFIAPKAEGIILQRNLLLAFTWVELLIAPLTAFLPLGLFALFVLGGSIWLGLFLVTILLGILAGLEVPLLTRILEEAEGVREALAGVLALDYLGGLLGSLTFPVLLLPFFGMFPTAFILGALPALMVFAIGRNFTQLRRWGYLGLGLGVLLLSLAPFAIPLSNNLENNLYSAPIIKRVQTAYQRIVLTHKGKDLRLFINGDLQLSSVDEYRYHEALVHPAMSATPNRKRVLVMGAGDGMAVREVLKWQDVERVVLIELDPEMIKLANTYPRLTKINQSALLDPRVEVIYADAFLKAPNLNETFDVIIADFPDPDEKILAKLYSEGFYRRLSGILAKNGILVTQASSPFFAPKVLSCIATTISQVGLEIHPYTVNVPSFGPWGFVLASKNIFEPEKLQLPIPTRFLTEPILHHLFELPKDIQLLKVEINRLSHPVIVGYQSDNRWLSY
ncbi:polyamine aminopropyltransferase [Mastigocoleus sp. MO_188.B34]|uniref:polyamine aminopropyltransferase n=1 Tax=Mastigocoleus sp. MO_188.B34 TaxID=3036635 RepID=UPI00260D0654|nr:polyamine aminopropyltransferase [Mastigocoleus sp. MO_188.B34]MDJ0696443.1 polyamine aminopropyltransferase [Mastigocoleus sp. MO_188.B34]